MTNKLFNEIGRKFKQSSKSDKLLVSAGLVLVLGMILLGLFASFVSPYGPYEMSQSRLSPPSTEHLFGTDYLGRDILSRMAYGTRISLLVAAVAASVSLILGASLGLFSGYFGGNMDRVIGLTMDALYSFPVIVLAIMMTIMLGPGVTSTAIGVGIALTPSYYRVTRSFVLSIKERGFIEGVRAIGAGDLHIMSRHILPNALPSLAVLASFNMAEGIISVAGLGFLGLGVQQPTPEWGADLKMGRDVLAYGAWWVSVFPGLMILAMVLGVNMLSEGVNSLFKLGVRRR